MSVWVAVWLYIMVCIVLEYARYKMHPNAEWTLLGKILFFPAWIFWLLYDIAADQVKN